MALSYIGTGITDNGTLSIRVNYPSTVLKNDLLIACICAHPDTSTITTFAGWTAITNGSQTGGTGSQGASTGPVKTACYLKVAAGGETGNNDWSVSGLSMAISRMHQFRSTTNNGLYQVTAANGADNTAGASWSVTAGQSLTTVPGDLILTVIGEPQGTGGAGSWTSDSLTGCGTLSTTGAEAFGAATAGNDGADRERVFLCTAGGSGAPVHTVTAAGTTTNIAGAEIFVQIHEVPSQALVINQEAINRSTLW